MKNYDESSSEDEIEQSDEDYQPSDSEYSSDSSAENTKKLIWINYILN